MVAEDLLLQQQNQIFDRAITSFEADEPVSFQGATSNTRSNINAELKPSEKKDHYHMAINGVILGEWERSQVRQLIGVLDEAINI